MTMFSSKQRPASYHPPSLGPSRGHPGTILGPSWNHPETILGHPGAILTLGQSWDHPGAILGPSLGHPGAFLGLSWDHPGIGAILGPSRCHPGVILKPSWDVPGTILGHLGQYWASGTAGWILGGIMGGPRCVWLQHVHVSCLTGAPRLVPQARLASPGPRFLTPGGGTGRVDIDSSVRRGEKS
jgi:hypothetical protein